MRAWEREKNLMNEAIPKILNEEEQTWDAAEDSESAEDEHVKILWKSHVPGSFAPESIMNAAVQAMENKGYIVENAEELIDQGFHALETNDIIRLHSISALLWKAVNNATIDKTSTYWTYKMFDSWEEFSKNVQFTAIKKYKFDENDLKNKLKAGWVSQIIGGAVGTAIEGYTTKNIRKVFGDIYDYVRKPNTYNDDITYELAFLKAYEKYGSDITSHDIALQWIGLIPTGWSAEEIALRNIRYGIFPPESGKFGNPFSEWIGAQMRGAICGMVAPGNPEEAARLAWIDGEVSHANNGIIGEVFNAMLVAESFVETDVRKILLSTMDMIPKESEYYEILSFSYEQCVKNEDWEKAWEKCEKRVEKYNWIHAYPNASAEVIALWYGNGDFDKTLHIISMLGQDVDCNAAQIMTVIGIIIGMEQIPKKWTEPIGDNLDTYVRSMKKMTITELTDWTYKIMDEKGIK